MMDDPRDTSLDTWLQLIDSHLHRVILPFWLDEAVDPRGGFVGEISCDHVINPEAPKGLILHARLLWTFSALYRRDPWGEYRNLAQRAWSVLMDRFWDAEQGGFWWALDASGVCVDDSKKIYGQAFAIYGLCEYARAFDRPEGFQKAQQVYDLIEQYAHDDIYGGYIEVCRADWSVAPDGRLSDKDMEEIKSMNNHLHLLEAYTQFYRCRPEGVLRQRLVQLIEIFEQHIVTPDRRHFDHFFDETWQRRSDNYTYGHDIEGSWLLVEAAEALGDEVLLQRVQGLALDLARACLAEGLDPLGGLYYEGRNGKPIETYKEWWPQAEAVVGFLNAYQLSEDPVFWQAASQLWEFIETRLVDHQRGEWFWRVDAQGRPDRTQPKLSAWKAPYHNVRACLETMERMVKLQRVLV